MISPNLHSQTHKSAGTTEEPPVPPVGKAPLPPHYCFQQADTRISPTNTIKSQILQTRYTIPKKIFRKIFSEIKIHTNQKHPHYQIQ